MIAYIDSLGCKLNQSECDEWKRSLSCSGWRITEDCRIADVIVLNTCSVTHIAARKSRQMVRRYARLNPGASIVVTGCYAELRPEAVAQLPGARLVLGMKEKDGLPDILTKELSCATANRCDTRPTALTRRTRAFVKVQDGCDNECAYCIVRIARGHHRSRSLQSVLDDVCAREAEGHQEVVLTGVHIGAYGRERGLSLADLVRTVLSGTHFPRLRLSSIEPWDATPELLSLWENPRLCRHLHLPLQSGCSATLNA